MSDGGTWQPPRPDSAWPDPAVPPSEQAAAAPEEPAPGRSRGRVIGATVGALALVGAGVFAVTRIAGDGGAGGAATPEDAGFALLEAMGDEDVLGAVDVMLPGERDALRQPLADLVDELARLEVLSEDADASAVSGVDLIVTDPDVRVEDTNVDDIVMLSMRATIDGSIDGDALPLGPWALEEVDDPAELDVEPGNAEREELRLAAVREDGRWYLSIFHTIAETLRAGTGEDIPADGIEPSGGESPEAAMDQVLEAAGQLDLEALIAALDPREFQALQRYAPLFLPDAQAALDEAPLDVEITDRSYTVSGSGDTRSVAVDAVTVELTADGERATAELRDGCWTVTAPDAEPVNSCQAADGDASALDEVLADALDDPQPVEDLIDAFTDTFADYENPGVLVRQVDGAWYLSPMATVTEQLLAVSRALTREELEQLAELTTDAVGAVEGQASAAFEELDDVDAPTVTVEPGDENPIEPGDENPAETVPSATAAVEPTDACWSEVDAALAAACFEALVAEGTIDAAEQPWYLRFEECGLAQIGWSGDYYGLPDEEFVAIVEDVAPCFQGLVDDGAAAEFDLPIELLRPDCLFGRNWYTVTEDAYLEQFEECAFG